MWNPFRKKFRVSIVDCFEAVKSAIMRDNFGWNQEQNRVLTLWEWLEVKHGVNRKYDWKTGTNYLVFNNEQEYTWFLLKL